MNKIKIKIVTIIILILAAVPLSAYAAEGDALMGTVGIIDDGTPQYGEAIFADVSNITNNTGTLSYQWVKDGVNIDGQTSNTYTLSSADIGANITVNVQSSVETGTLSSAAVTPGKADRAAPAAPTLLSKDHYNITLNEVAGCEYKISGGSYSDVSTFSGLIAKTEYTFYQRYKETATHNASPVSDGLTVTTDYVTISNTSYDISTLKAGDGVFVSGNVTLTGSRNIRILCDAGVTLTLNGVSIDVSAMSGQSAIEFTGSSNRLILKGSNNVRSGSSRAGIEVEGSLIISGNGSLYVKGGANGAGIGGSNLQNAGSISINLAGSRLTAVGGTNGAGIGGGNGGNGGLVNVTGGYVFAAGSSADDIGGGNGGSGGSLGISGVSAVFIKSNLAPTPSSSSHGFYSDEAVSGGKAYGYSVPGLWTEGTTAYAYIRMFTVNFDTNGAGTIASQQVAAGTYAAAPGEITREDYIFEGWYSDSSLNIPFNFAATPVNADITLYARWDVEVTISSGENGSVNKEGVVIVKAGGDLTITCEPDDTYYVSEVISQQGHNVTDNGDDTYTIKNIQSKDSITVNFECLNLLGEVTILHDELPEFRDQLKANTTKILNNPEGAQLKYQWTRDGKDIPNATKESYMLVVNDIGHKIAVNVSSTQKEGFITSKPIMTIQKAMKPAPRAPIVLDKTMYSVTLYEIEGCEYMIEGGLWQESNVFENLQPETEYVFFQRYAETDTHKKSNTSFSLKVFTYGYSIEEVVFQKDFLRMHKSDTENIISLMPYSISPKKVENDEVIWTSSNTNVAIIDSTNGTITALNEGKTIITITAADTKNGIITDTLLLQVFDPAPEDANAYLGALTGRLTDSQGKVLSGYTITVYSNPIALKTDEAGQFKLDFIPYTRHILVVEDDENNEIGRFIINWILGDQYKTTIDNEYNILNIIYTDVTASVNLPIEVNKDFNDIKIKTVEGVSFVEEEPDNQVQSKKIYVLIMLSIIAACIIGVGYILYIGRIRKSTDYGDEIGESVYFEQQLLEENNKTNKNDSRDDEQFKG